MTDPGSAQHGPLPHLDTFSKAAELGSFTAAARELGITQAAVSQRVQTLERSLDVSLFERKGGRVSLTESGTRLYEFAQRILDLHREAREAVTGAELPVEGELLLAASSIPGEHLLPAALSIFRARHPAITVRASVDDSLAVLDHVESGRVQLGLVGRRIDKPHLLFRPFASDELVLIVGKEDRWKRRRKVRLAEVLSRPVILREPGSGSRWCLEQALLRAAHCVEDLDVALELGSNESIKEAVQNGTGVAVLSRFAVQRDLDEGRLHGIAIDGLELSRTLFVVSDSRRALPRPARAFLQFLLARCDQFLTPE
ncbi:MAG: selenium metabolism-associated LysR family transcriptional regulator, partial [Planctomycetota bacterium]|nr:selenium metabolism-associated LysR family transcriptional regulator [Planctomycetota bacterium]